MPIMPAPLRDAFDSGSHSWHLRCERTCPVELEGLSMLYDATRAFSQLFTPPFRRLLFKCVGLSLILLVVSGFALDRVLQAFVSTPYPWLDTAIAVAAALGIVAAAIFLTPPVTIIVAGLYLDEIADLVEQRYYPDDPPGTPQPLIRSIWLSVVFFLVVLAVNLVALMLLLVPGLNLVAFFLGQRLSARPRIFRARRHALSQRGSGQGDAARQRTSRSSLAGCIVAVVVSIRS